jgi:hypothetical protein
MQFLQINLQLILQEQLFVAEPSQLPALVCLAMQEDEDTALALVTAATGYGNDTLAANLTRFPESAQQAMQQQLAGDQLQMLLEAAIAGDKDRLLWSLLKAPAAAQLSGDVMVQLLQQAVLQATQPHSIAVGVCLVDAPAAGQVTPAAITELLTAALQFDVGDSGGGISQRVCLLMCLPHADGIEAAPMLEILKAALAAQTPLAVSALCDCSPAAHLSPSLVQKLLQQAVDVSPLPAAAAASSCMYVVDGIAYPNHAASALIISKLPGAQQMPLVVLQAWLQQALQQQDGAMVAALLCGIRPAASRLGANDTLQYLKAAVALEQYADAAVHELCRLPNSTSIPVWGDTRQVDALEQLLGAALQRRGKLDAHEAQDADSYSSAAASLAQLPGMWTLSPQAVARLMQTALEHQIPDVALRLLRLPGMKQVPTDAVAQMLEAALKQEEPASVEFRLKVVQDLCEVPSAVTLERAVVADLIEQAVEFGWEDTACGLEKLLQRIGRENS